MGAERSVIITRHGSRQDIVDPLWAKSALLPDDPPLSEGGRLQARELGDRLRVEGISHIFASPFLRAVETACFVAEALDARVKVERGLSEWLRPEWFRAWPELTPPTELAARFPRVDVTYRFRVQPRHPETERELLERVARTVRALLADFDGNLLLVGHGASVEAAAWALAGEGWRVGSSLCAMVKLVSAGGGWRVVLNGDTAYLSGPRAAPAPE